MCEEIRERISSDDVTEANYVTTDNMLKGCSGIRPADSVPADTSLVHYAKGDVLLSNIRPYLKKAWMADRTGGCSSDVIVLRNAGSNLAPEYLFRVLSQDSFFDYVMQNVNGTKMPRGKRDWIKRFVFPLPPRPVQREIVGRLERELAEADRLAANFKRIAELADAEFKAELDETFEGRDGECIRLGDVCSFVRREKAPVYCDSSPYAMFAQKCNQPDGIHLEKCKFCETIKYHKFAPAYHLKDKDIVVNSTGTGTLGRVGLFREEYLHAFNYKSIVADSHVTIVRTSERVLPEYLFFYMRRDSIYKWINDVANGSTNQKELYPQTLVALVLPIVPLTEQQVIVDKLYAAQSRCDQLKIASGRGIHAAEALHAAILSEAFTQ